MVPTSRVSSRCRHLLLRKRPLPEQPENVTAANVHLPQALELNGGWMPHAALVGIATTLAAPFGFYLAGAAILDLGAHPWYTDLKLTLGSGRVYETWGLLSGSIYGALGGMWASRSLVAAPIAVGLAFICEPVIVLLLVRAGIWGGGGLFEHPWMWITEVLIGSAPSRSSSPGRRRARPRTPEQFQR